MQVECVPLELEVQKSDDANHLAVETLGRCDQLHYRHVDGLRQFALDLGRRRRTVAHRTLSGRRWWQLR
jgi:hypothetical protein